MRKYREEDKGGRDGRENGGIKGRKRMEGEK